MRGGGRRGVAWRAGGLPWENVSLREYFRLTLYGRDFDQQVELQPSDCTIQINGYCILCLGGPVAGPRSQFYSYRSLEN